MLLAVPASAWSGRRPSLPVPVPRPTRQSRWQKSSAAGFISGINARAARTQNPEPRQDGQEEDRVQIPSPNQLPQLPLDTAQSSEGTDHRHSLIFSQIKPSQAQRQAEEERPLSLLHSSRLGTPDRQLRLRDRVPDWLTFVSFFLSLLFCGHHPWCLLSLVCCLWARFSKQSASSQPQQPTDPVRSAQHSRAEQSQATRSEVRGHGHNGRCHGSLRWAHQFAVGLLGGTVTVAVAIRRDPDQSPA